MTSEPVTTAVTEGAGPQHALLASIRALRSSLSPAQIQVVDTMTRHVEVCSLLTVSEFAERTGTSPTTVVRTAHLLGYSGYRALQRAMVELSTLQAGHSLGNPITCVTLDDSLTQVVATLVWEERQVLADTALLLSIDQLESSVAALCSARHIDVYGIGASGAVADDLASKLRHIGLVAHARTEAHRAMDSAGRLQSGDAVVALSHSGTAPGVVGPLRQAASSGARTIAITSHPRSPVACDSDHLLSTAASRASGLRSAAMSSRASQLLVVDCLFTGAAQRIYRARAERGLAAAYQVPPFRQSDRLCRDR